MALKRATSLAIGGLPMLLLAQPARTQTTDVSRGELRELLIRMTDLLD